MKNVVRAALAATLFGIVSLGNATQAQQSNDPSLNPVVVELYTSQGCSSCPPADAILASIAGRNDVIALALHVDYWDYIGWKDDFAQAKFTDRQKLYAQVAGARSIYTPQMIIGGRDNIVGAKKAELAALIADHAATAHVALLTLTRAGDDLTIAAPAAPTGGKMVVQLVRYIPAQSVDIRQGENGGRTIEYVNIVTNWDRIGEWNGVAPLDMKASVTGDAPIVVILQAAGQGPILAAARLR